jgi:hypothetical protein
MNLILNPREFLKGKLGAISRDSEIIFDCKNFLKLEC